KGDEVQHPKLPFRVLTKLYYPISLLQPRAQVQNPPPPVASKGPLAERYVVTPQPLTYKQDERNMPVASIELAAADGSLGSWLVATAIPVLERDASGAPELVWKEPSPQRFDYGGRTWEISLRSQRSYKPFTITLLKFSN